MLSKRDGDSANSGLPSPDEAAIVLEDVSKQYLLSFYKPEALKTAILQLPSFLRGGRGRWPFWALSDIHLTVRRGESLGVIGPNGSGKSTLLRTMARIAPPTKGRVTVRGRISALLELGAGFHPQISGRENAILNAVLQGLSLNEARGVLPEIVEFSELGDFIDQPMRTYSSGMYGRLAFAVAVTMEPEILLIDEALSVGDARFRRKSANKMRELCSQARTIILVSHALGTVRELCDQALWMDKGVMRMWDEPETVVDAYTEFLEVSQDAVTLEDV